MTTTTAKRTSHRKLLALADATLALQRAEALQRIEAIITLGETSIGELQAILPLLDGHRRGLLEDVIGAIATPGCRSWSTMLRELPRWLA